MSFRKNLKSISDNNWIQKSPELWLFVVTVSILDLDNIGALQCVFKRWRFTVEAINELLQSIVAGFLFV